MGIGAMWSTLGLGLTSSKSKVNGEEQGWEGNKRDAQWVNEKREANKKELRGQLCGGDGWPKSSTYRAIGRV